MTRTEFEHIAVALRQRVLKVGLDFFGNRADAEDVAQETMALLWGYCEHIDAVRNVEALAVRVAKNCCVSLNRKRRPSVEIDIPALQRLESDGSPEALLEAEDMQQMLSEAMEQLKPRERQLFEMKHMDDLSIAEIAEKTGIPKTSVAAMVSAARRKVIMALRIILSTAAVYLVGMFFWLQKVPETHVRNTAKDRSAAREQHLGRYCKDGTPKELYECYIEHRQKHPKTYSVIKKRLYENQQ